MIDNFSGGVGKGGREGKIVQKLWKITIKGCCLLSFITFFRIDLGPSTQNQMKADTLRIVESRLAEAPSCTDQKLQQFEDKENMKFGQSFKTDILQFSLFLPSFVSFKNHFPSSGNLPGWFGQT